MQNQRQAISIPRGEAGTNATMAIMRSIAEAGRGESLTELFPIDTLDESLRRAWYYVPDGRHETIRTIARMAVEFPQDLPCDVDGVFFGVKPAGFIAGDCDDAATLAAAILLHRRGLDSLIGKITIVAVRPYNDEQFRHVFLYFDYAGVPTRIDPTAPTNADYSKWEKMSITF